MNLLGETNVQQQPQNQAKLDDFGPDTWVFRKNMRDNSNLSLYMASIYFALTTLATVGYGDICSKTNSNF